MGKNRLRALDTSWDFLGFGLAQLAYIEAYKTFLSISYVGQFVLDAYWTSAMLAAAVSGVVAVIGVTTPRIRSASITIALFGTLLGSALLALFFAIPHIGFAFASAIMLGMSCALLWTAWQDRFSEMTGASVIFCLAVCSIVMAIFHVASTLYPNVQAPLTICSQLGAFILLLSGFQKGNWPKTSKQDALYEKPLVLESFLSPASIVLMMFVFSFSYHFATKTVYSGTNDLFRDAEDIVSGCIMLAIFFMASRCRFANILRVGLPIITLLYLLVQMLPTDIQPACIIVSGSASKLIQLFLTVLIIYMAGKETGKRRWALLSFGVFASFGGRLASGLALMTIEQVVPTQHINSVVIYTLLIVLLLTLLVSMASQSRNTDSLRPSEITEHAGDQDVAEDTVIDSIAQQYNLTARETEVLSLLAQGRTRSVIASKLCISNGTAHAHISHIYAKMDIHSQQELLDLIENKA